MVKPAAQWAVMPDIRPWRGDNRRNRAPYVLCGDMFIDSMGHAQQAARALRARGIPCYVELIG